MEEIARQVPLSRLERPKWDLDTMKKTGFLDVFCDENVWKEVWTEEEIINNSSSPIFLLTGRKCNYSDQRERILQKSGRISWKTFAGWN